MKNPQTLRKFQEEGAPIRAVPKGSNKESPPTIKRLNINLPRSVFDELEGRARDSGRTMTEIVRVGLGLLTIAVEEEKKGNRLVIADPKGKAIKEIVLPK